MSDEKIRIKACKLYQSATFEKRAETHFTCLPVANKVSPTIEFNKELMCVEIKSTHDHILVPLTNIACIYLWDESADKYIEDRETAMKVTGTLKAHDIKKVK
jgi:hypothetical protein